MTHPINIVSDKEINDRIKDFLFLLREEGIVRDETIHDLSSEQYRHLVIKLIRENIIRCRLVLHHERCVEHRGRQLDDIKSAVKIIKNVLKDKYKH